MHWNLKKNRVINWVLTIGVFLLIAIQFIPVNRSNPSIIKEPPWNSQRTKELVSRSCYDCHSNQTKWPVYSYIAPVSWLVAGHVNEGRRELNFSEWKGFELEEILEEINDGKMPIKSYLFIHPGARLNQKEKKELIEGLKLTIKNPV